MTSDLVKTRCEGAIARVTLNRPEARNAVNLDLCHALQASFDAFQGDTETAVVILDAEGPVFCAGADMRERKGKDEAWVVARRQASFRAYAAIEACPIPVVCAVQGPVVGSGGEISMACDFIVASDATTFLFPEPQWGTVGATQRLQRRIGVARAKELLFTGRKMGAEEAYALGLVARLVRAADLSSEVEAIAEKIASAPKTAMRLTKQAVDQGSRTDLTSGIEVEMAAIRQLLVQSDWKAGVEKFSKEVGNAG
ncbi:enoyl-CoA hydratase/isomerase family protein [Celeribacter sp. PS-C1]|uniref:enoyl-CoA hydratase/isomerase family protein n=1 Tax=Celeribacter sp. PS-C1 TaxID=2820813 RepID=UPI001C67FE8F|nr:enoyl-CoA hydratase/isomerase family protein [Celeribacter sp. PS-C1]MBW6417033.1 enoyl-CoA hydratase/isomerase family protein [Celeribacter sp. PS-C1]